MAIPLPAAGNRACSDDDHTADVGARASTPLVLPTTQDRPLIGTWITGRPRTGTVGVAWQSGSRRSLFRNRSQIATTNLQFRSSTRNHP